MRALALAVLLAASACAGAQTARGVACDFGARLEALRDWPLAVRCQAVEDAAEACRRAGLPPDCYRDGWNDCDRDGPTVAACLRRE